MSYLSFIIIFGVKDFLVETLQISLPLCVTLTQIQTQVSQGDTYITKVLFCRYLYN